MSLPGPDARPDAVEISRMPLMEHLRELRYRLIVSAASLGVGMVIGLVFASTIFDVLRAPIDVVFNEKPQNAADEFYLWATSPLTSLLPSVHVDGSLNIASSPLEGMYSFFQVGLIGGALLAAPIVAFQLWRFVQPALYPTERNLVMPLALSSTFLFMCGVSFCYFVMFPVMFPFFLTQLAGVTAVVSVQGYLESVVWMMIGMGGCFQLPVVVWLLAKLGIVDHKDLIGFFRYAIVGAFLVSAIVTPTSDIFTQTVVAVPLLGLYVIGIVVAWFSSTKVRDGS